MRSLFALTACTLAFAVTITAGYASESASNRKVMAFYYTWYGTPQYQENWVHWNEAGHNPDRKDARGVPDTGTTDHPLNLYDSNDPSAIRQHLKLAGDAGIDVLISTWWEQGDYHDKAAMVLVSEAEKTPIKISLYYERIPGSSDDIDIVSKTVKDFDYILDTHAQSSAFFRHDGKPVIFIYSRAVGQLSKDQWREVVNQVKQKHPVMLVADSRSPQWLDVFDAIHEYNSVGQVVAKENYLEQAKKLVDASKKQGRIAAVTVIPGYDDSNIGRLTPIVAKRFDGQLYRDMWSSAVKSKPDWVLICSFNEWHEGSEIEPSIEYGNKFIDLTSQYAQNLKQGRHGIYKAPKLPANLSVKSTNGMLLSVKPDTSGAVVVTNLSGGAGPVYVTTPQAGNILVFETGRFQKPFRRVDAQVEKITLSWKLRPYTTYQVWTDKALSSYLSKRQPAKDSSDLMLNESLAADKLGIKTSVQFNYPDQLPSEYKICVDRPFNITCTVSNQGKKSVKASLVKLQTPDNWNVTTKSTTKPVILKPGSKASVTYSVTIPVRCVYGYTYPVSAWWKVNDLTVHNTLGFNIVPPFEKDLYVDSKFPDQADMILTLKPNFPGTTMKNLTVEPDVPEGWKVSPKSTTVDLAKEAKLKFHVTKPSSKSDETNIVGTIFKLGEYRGSKRVVANLYLRLAERARVPGLWQIDVEDGKTQVTSINGRTCRRATDLTPGNPCYVYFGVSENLPTSGRIYVTVHFYDQGTDPFELQYDSTDPEGGLQAAYKSTTQAVRTDTQTWKSHTFILTDARFGGGQNGQADFRIASLGSGIVIDWITVSKFPPLQ